MLDELKLVHLPPSVNLADMPLGSVFILSTCQRTLVMGHHIALRNLLEEFETAEFYQSTEAYLFMLETLCGLKSKLMGENEIVAQFKNSYNQFLSLPQKNPFLLDVIHKLLKDAKEVRTKHLHHVGQYSYSGITKKILEQQAFKKPIWIFGSGALANDLVKILDKKHPLYLCARNQEKANEIKNKYPSIQLIPWSEKERWASYPFLINTISKPGPYFEQPIFDSWYRHHDTSQLPYLFIDLSSPTVLENCKKGNEILLLEDIFKKGTELDQKKMVKITEAKELIKKIAKDRHHSFSIHYPFGWEELQFA